MARESREREEGWTDLEVAVGVEEEVGGLEVPVDDVGAVHRLERAERLVDEVLFFATGMPSRSRQMQVQDRSIANRVSGK